MDDVTGDDRRQIEQTVGNTDQDVAALLDNVGTALSSVTQGSSLGLTPKHEAPN